MSGRRWRPFRWLLGLPFLAALCAIALFGELPSVQDDLAKRAGDALQAAKLGWAKVDFSGRDGRLTGTATADPDRAAAVKTVLENWGVRVVDDQSTLVAALSPYTWSMARDGGNVETRGFAGNDADRKAAADAAAGQIHGLSLKQDLKLARGMPPREQWLGAIGFASTQMAGLSRGQASLSDLGLTISGVAASPEAFAEISKALGGPLPSGVKLIKVEIAPPNVSPYRWQADWKQRKVVLDGYAPDEHVRGRIVRTATSVFPGADIVDHLAIASGAPEHFAEAATVALTQLARLEGGAASLTDTSAELGGVAVEQDDAEAASAAFKKGLPNGYTASTKVTFRNARVPTAKPFVWSGAFADKTIELTGVVPDQKTKDEIAAFVVKRFSGVRLEDHTTIARGAPFGFEQAAIAGLDQLGRLDRGSVRLEDMALTVTGRAPDQDTAEGLKTPLIAALPHGYATEVAAVADPPKVVAPVVQPAPAPRPVIVLPYVWDAALDHATLTLTGATPGLQARDTMLDHVRGILHGTTLQNKLSQINGVPSSQDDWLATVDAGLKAIADLGGGHAHIDDHMLTVSGVSNDKGQPEAIARFLTKSVPSAYQVVTHIDYVAPPAPPPPPKPVVVVPYVWDALLDRSGLTLSGATPGLQARDFLLGIIHDRMPGVPLQNKLSQINGVPSSQDDWLATVGAGLKVISDLGAGHAHIDEHTLTVSGTTKDKAAPDAIAKFLSHAVPPSYQVVAQIDYIAPPPPPMPYVTTLHYDGLKVTLDGTVPDVAARAKLLARIKPLFPERDFEDHSAVLAGAPDGWVDALVLGAGPLATLAAGDLTLHDRALVLAGKAQDQKILDAARQRIAAGLPGGFDSDNHLTYEPPPAPDPALLAKKKDEAKYDVGKLMRQTADLDPGQCQAVLNEAFKGRIFFDSGRADLQPRSVDALNGIVTVAKRCPATHFEIDGFTDSDGAPAWNKRLSERRAQIVLRFMVEKGIDVGRIKAVGFGQERPVAPNDTPENKSRNRRIEFVVTAG